jgi:hypothetical protein
LEKFPWADIRIFILQLLDGIICRCLLRLTVDYLILKFPYEYFFFGLDDLSKSESGKLKSPTMIVIYYYICVLISSSVCFMKLGAMTFGEPNLNNPWWSLHLVNMNWHSLFLLTNFGFKSALSDVNIATLACFQAPFDWKIFFFLLSLEAYICLCQWGAFLVGKKWSDLF